MLLEVMKNVSFDVAKSRFYQEEQRASTGDYASEQTSAWLNISKN